MDKALLDRAVQAAWPPGATAPVGPWTARLDAGVTRRPNSVIPHGAGAEPDDATLDRWLDDAVTLYGTRGLTPWIQVTEAAWPPRLEAWLAGRGWETEIDPTLLLTAPVPAAGPSSVVTSRTPSEDWVRAWWSVDPRGGDAELEACRRILGRIEGATYATAIEGCHTLGVGLGVVVGGLVVLECIATVPAARRRGVASRVVQALGAHGAAAGAHHALLAVQASNVAARALYERLGFTRAGAYAYARPPA